MPEEATQDHAPEAQQQEQHEAPPEPVESHTARTVPYERFQEVNKQRKAAADELAAFRSRIEEIESKDQSELQRERKKREQFEREAGELAQTVARIERQSWLRDAARDLKFDDPEDACAFIDVKHLEEPDDAVQAVKDLAKRKPRLVRTESPPSEIGQVVKHGQQVRQQQGARQQQQGQQGQQAGQPAALSPDESAFLAQLEEAKASSGWQSIPMQ